MKLLRNTIVVGFVAILLFASVNTGFGSATDIVGTVEQKGEVVVLFTPDDTYVLNESDMLPEMIGKKVSVTGTVEEKEQVKYLTVAGFEEVEEKKK
jgi:hypothetical protein